MWPRWIPCKVVNRKRIMIRECKAEEEPEVVAEIQPELDQEMVT